MTELPEDRDFQITNKDLDRIEQWMKEQLRGMSLDAIIRRLVRGRVLYGEDWDGNAITTLAQYIDNAHVLSWNQLEQWQIGSLVLVARNIDNKICPRFGMITSVERYGSDECFIIQIGDKKIKYAKFHPGSNEVKLIVQKLTEAIQQEQLFHLESPGFLDIESKINHVILEKGPQIASQVIPALEMDSRFLQFKQSWYLTEWVIPLEKARIRRLHKELLLCDDRSRDYSSICNFFWFEVPKFGEYSLWYHLKEWKDSFQETDDGWLALEPPPPTWENAKGTCYVYNPKNFQIILKPGERLTQSKADLLFGLGFYADVVSPIEIDY